MQIQRQILIEYSWDAALKAAFLQASFWEAQIPMAVRLNLGKLPLGDGVSC